MTTLTNGVSVQLTDEVSDMVEEVVQQQAPGEEKAGGRNHGPRQERQGEERWKGE